MDKVFNLRMPKEFVEALEEAKWTLRKSMAELVREAIVEYFERHLPEDALKKVKKILEGESREAKPKKK